MGGKIFSKREFSTAWWRSRRTLPNRQQEKNGKNMGVPSRPEIIVIYLLSWIFQATVVHIAICTTDREGDDQAFDE
jgi:hypothetical protein